MSIINTDIKKKTIQKKLPLTEDFVNEFMRCILGFDLKERETKCFSLEELETNKAIDKYMKGNMGNKLREYITVHQCRKVSLQNEEILSEKDLITILRCCLKYFNYELDSYYAIGTNKKTVYKITVMK